MKLCNNGKTYGHTTFCHDVVMDLVHEVYKKLIMELEKYIFVEVI